MKPKLPQGTRAEKVAFARNLYRQDQLGRAKIRIARAKRRWVVAGQAVVVALTVVAQVVVGLSIVPEGKALAIPLGAARRPGGLLRGAHVRGGQPDAARLGA